MNVLFVAVHTENRQVRIKKYTIETKYIYCNFCVWNNWVKSCCDWFKNGWCSQILCWLKKKNRRIFRVYFSSSKIVIHKRACVVCHVSLFPLFLSVYFIGFLSWFSPLYRYVPAPARTSIDSSKSINSGRKSISMCDCFLPATNCLPLQ